MKKIATLCAAAAMLAVPATASAETIKQTGEIVGDSETRVTLKVEVTSLGPVSVTDFKAKNVFTRCDKKPSRLDFKALSPIDVVSEDGTFKTRLTNNEGGFLRIAGKVKNNGQATVGSLKTNEIESGDSICKTPKQKFKTSAK